MRCPSCGARNADSAAWCTQCYATFGGDEAPAAADAPGLAPDAADVGAPPVSAPAGGTGGPEGPVDAATSDGRFRRTDEGLDWRCALCGTWNPIERQTCRTCQQPFARTIAPADEPVAVDVDETVAVAASLALPGAGHLLLGRRGAGVLRMLLYLTWLGGGFLLLRAAAAEEQSILPAVPLLLGAFAVLAAAVVEVQQTTTGNDLTILSARATLWLVVGVLGALMLSFLAATMAVTGG